MKLGVRQLTLLLRGHKRGCLYLRDVRSVFGLPNSTKGRDRSVAILEGLEARNLVRQQENQYLKTWVLTAKGQKKILNHMDEKY